MESGNHGAVVAWETAGGALMIFLCIANWTLVAVSLTVLVLCLAVLMFRLSIYLSFCYNRNAHQRQDNVPVGV